jgi:hypothetical protein
MSGRGSSNETRRMHPGVRWTHGAVLTRSSRDGGRVNENKNENPLGLAPEGVHDLLENLGLCYVNPPGGETHESDDIDDADAELERCLVVTKHMRARG